MSFDYPTEEVTEGPVTITIPKNVAITHGRGERAFPRAPVFYNPRMGLNRDVAVLALRAYHGSIGRGLRVCEPMAGCGVRGMRFAVQVEGVERVVMNDLNPEAVQLARQNVEANGLSDRIVIESMEANVLLSLHSSPCTRFDVVDLDPFGSPSPFIESAIRALHNRGMIALTATDTAPLCGVNPEVSLRKYFGRSLRTEYCHELAVRLLINCLVLSAARHGFGTHVLISHSTDHYIRVYAQMRRGAVLANESLRRIGYILHCFNCLHRKIALDIADLPPTECDRCGGSMDLAGPLWLGELSDHEFCSRMIEDVGSVSLSEAGRVGRLLSLVLREADGPPTYYVVDKISEKMGVPTPSRARVIDSLIERGYKTTPIHFNPRGIKSNAPIEVVGDVIEKLIHT